jgi:hypothetical protein
MESIIPGTGGHAAAGGRKQAAGCGSKRRSLRRPLVSGQLPAIQRGGGGGGVPRGQKSGKNSGVRGGRFHEGAV